MSTYQETITENIHKMLEEMNSMNVGERISNSHLGYEIVRLPMGWIYTRFTSAYKGMNSSSCFIPLDKKWQEYRVYMAVESE